MAVFGYRRVSTDGQEEGTSLQDQTVKIKALAILGGLSDPEMIEDVCSGSVPLKERKGGRAMWSRLKAGDSVIVAKLDRCFRNASDALVMADEFKTMGVNLYLIDMGTEPVTQNGVSRMFFGMLALVAEFERTRIKERLADGRAGKKAKGGHIGGKRPFGFDVVGQGKEAVLVPRQDEQRAISDMIAMKAAGASLRKIAEAMQAKGFAVSHVTVGRVLEGATD